MTQKETEKAVIAVDIGGTKIAGSIFSVDGQILFEENQLLGSTSGAAASDLVTGSIGSLLRIGKEKQLNITAIGISVPGIVYQSSGEVWVPNIRGWKDFPLAANIKRSLPTSSLPVRLESDRSCYILGEMWMGNARGVKNAVFVAVGTGIGAGIAIDGKVLHGANDIAGSVGWLALDRPFATKYVDCGCFEYHASGSGLVKVALEKLSRDHQTGSYLQTIPKSQISGEEIFRAYHLGDAVATEVIDEAIEYWGMTVANIVSLLNPEKIIFGGGIFGPALEFLERIRIEAAKWAQPISMSRVDVLGSALGGKAGIYGAAKIALDSLF